MIFRLFAKITKKLHFSWQDQERNAYLHDPLFYLAEGRFLFTWITNTKISEIKMIFND